MYLIIWEYGVKKDRLAEFERIYSSTGTWAELFRKSKGDLGTELLRNGTDPQRFLTLDHWNSKEDYEEFLETWKQDYKALDQECEGLTEQGALMGKYETA